uniref:Uncharacterized protein n=1 Tax=Kalanchoe fedtschenkoi TaxID=63787 RepID=A0A7N0T5K6_KALFE
MGRAPCCDKANVKRGPWSPEEDEILKSYIQQHGTGGNWIALPSKAGLKRCGKSCRLRWLNYLRPDIKHGAFTEEEDRVIFSLYYEIGSRWSIIAAKLHGRTDNDVKNHWNTKLKKLIMLKDQADAYPEFLRSTKPAHSSFSGSADHESYSFVRFPSLKTETHQESLPPMPNLPPGVSGYDGSSLAFMHHDPAGFTVPAPLLSMPTYHASKATAIPPNSSESELSGGSSSTMNAGTVSWPDGGGSGVEDGGLLNDILIYGGEGMNNGCRHMFQSTFESGNQKCSSSEDLGNGAAPTFSAMLSDYIYELKPQGVFQNQNGLIDQY